MPPLPCGNAILDSLALERSAALGNLLRQAALVEFLPGTVLQRAGEPIDHAYFPVRGMLALTCDLHDGGMVSVLGVGRDGAVQAIPNADLDASPWGLVAPVAGACVRIGAHDWQDALADHAGMRSVLGRYAGHLLARSHQATACYVKHDVESRMCGWLIDLDLSAGGRPIAITHEGLAALLGVRRTTVTLIARGLLGAGIITYRRGQIEIVDRYALQQASCECHRVHAAADPPEARPQMAHG